MKICTYCKKTHSEQSSRCKTCIANKNLSYRLRNNTLSHKYQKKCVECKLTFPLVDYYRSSKRLVSGHKKYYSNNICKGCCAIKYKGKQTNCNPQVSRERAKAYMAGKKERNHCWQCTNELTEGNTSGYCLYCYVHRWAYDHYRKTIIRYPHLEGVLQQRMLWIQNNVLHILQLADATGFPYYRLGHKETVHRRPEKTLELTNIKWKFRERHTT